MPAELDNLDPAMDQTGAETPDMGSDPMGSEGPEMGHGDQEGAMAKQELIKLANYATNLQEHIEDNEQLEAWVQSKITIAATNIASVYHYMAYEKKIGEYGDALDSAPISESQKRVLKFRLNEAKEKLKALKQADAAKMAENAFDWKNKKEEDLGEEFTDKSKVGDTFKTRTGVATKTSTGVKHTNTSYADDGEAEQKSGKGVKSHAKAQSAAEKKERAPAQKMSPKSAKTWGMKDNEKFDNRDKVDEAKSKMAKKDYDQDGKTSTNEAKMAPGHMAHHHACEYSKHHKAGNLELAMHHKEACENHGGTISHGAMGECYHTHPHLNGGGIYECPGVMMEAKSKMAKKDYDKDGKVESGKDEYLGSKIRAAKKAGKLKECGPDCTCAKCKAMKESAPSAGLSKEKKSAVVKKAKAGGDIGKPGKGFDKLAKSAGGGEKGKKIAAAAMWKNIKETQMYVAEKAKAVKDLPGKQEKLDVDKDGKLEKSDFAALRAGKKTKETVKESTDFTRMQEQIARLNRSEKPALVENREVDQIRALTKRLLG